MPRMNSAPYATTKHGLVGLMRSTVQDLAGRGIHSACVCPGFTDTEMLRGHINNDPEVIAAITANVSHQRLIDPDEIARCLQFCAENPVISGLTMSRRIRSIRAEIAIAITSRADSASNTS